MKNNQQFMNSALLTVKDVMGLTSMSRSTIHVKVTNGTFPAPIRLSARCVRWHSEAVRQWIDGAQSRDFGAEVDEKARLIAAAPDLLEAAKLVIAWYEAEDDHSKADFYQRMEMCRQSEAACRAAIAKATGATNV